MKIQLLVDSGEFWESVKADVGNARHRVYAQALSFEGDGVGRAMAEALLASPASDRRVMIDTFTNHIVNDRFLWKPSSLLDRSLRAEVRATRRMIDDLVSGGVLAKFTNPAGFLFSRFPSRNHKKLVLVDDRAVYVGGINFSDHNFAWHDVMLRIEDPGAAELLAEDFLSSWGGRHRPAVGRFPGLDLHVLDGATNEKALARVLSLIDGAQESVWVECPYLTSPFLERLSAARARGVSVTVVTPEKNNWPLVRRALVRHAAESNLDVRFYPDRMTHMKALLVDREVLVVGSANFDVWSYRFQQEFFCVVTDPALVADFRERVVAPDMERSRPCGDRHGRLACRMSVLELAALDALSALWKRLRAPATASPHDVRIRPAEARG